MEMDFLTAPNAAATSSIFSFDQVDEFFHSAPVELLRQQEEVTLSSVLQDVTGGVVVADPVIVPSPRQSKQRSPKGLTALETKPNPNGAAAATSNKSDKKVIHRDIERLRRQEMASLYGSLRSHLPLEFLKGKRSISDHILEAVKYIRHLQNEIGVLSEKRDVLKRMTELKGDQTNAGESSDQVFYDSRDTVTINPCMEGVDVMVNTSWRQGIPQSRILQVLMRGGLNVISFNTTLINERVIYSIQAEVESQGDVNLAELRHKLMNLRV